MLCMESMSNYLFCKRKFKSKGDGEENKGEEAEGKTHRKTTVDSDTEISKHEWQT